MNLRKKKRVGKGCIVFYNLLCLEERGGPISLPSTRILYRKHFAISSLTFLFFIYFYFFILVILLQIVIISTIKFLVNLNFHGKLLLCLVDYLY